MKFIKLAVLVSGLSVLALACDKTGSVNGPATPTPANSPVAASTPPPDPFASTREVYSDKCSACHQDNGEGGLVKIEGKRLKVPPLTRGHALGHSDDELAKQVSKGGGGMPPFKEKLKPEEIDNLVVFIRKTFQSGSNVKGGNASTDSIAPSSSDMKKDIPMDMPKR